MYSLERRITYIAMFNNLLVVLGILLFCVLHGLLMEKSMLIFRPLEKHGGDTKAVYLGP
jgi:hypothetical protein